MYISPSPAEWPELVKRYHAPGEQVEETVRAILDEVRQRGDAALREYAWQFDKATFDDIALSETEIAERAAQTPPAVQRAIEAAAQQITRFHEAQLPQEVRVETAPGVCCLQRPVPLQSVGLYIPGGRAPLFSTVLMLALPARIAGCKEIILCTPQGADGRIAPEILYAARYCGVHRIFRVGGAQAVAAMAYGTESIPAVDKIFGPGNRYVTCAKQLVSTVTSIDMPAGPSEVMVLADDTAKPAFVAADLLSQAEHGPDSQAMLVCQTTAMAEAVAREVERQCQTLKRTELLESSLRNSRTVVFESREEMVAFANAYAAEHLIISMEHPWEIAQAITAAGSIFIGNYSPESAGDYASGTNHTLPTSGWARSYSGVNMDSYFRKITYQELTPEGLRGLSSTIVTMAEAEGLDAHANAVRVRMENP